MQIVLKKLILVRFDRPVKLVDKRKGSYLRTMISRRVNGRGRTPKKELITKESDFASSTWTNSALILVAKKFKM